MGRYNKTTVWVIGSIIGMLLLTFVFWLGMIAGRWLEVRRHVAIAVEDLRLIAHDCVVGVGESSETPLFGAEVPPHLQDRIWKYSYVPLTSGPVKLGDSREIVAFRHIDEEHVVIMTGTMSILTVKTRNLVPSGRKLSWDGRFE